ncbi:TPA: conjugal transfer protein TrbH [Legionella pneumophila subsp. pneumophila]|nr:conjugal transfer protein TrbH [Legionella pneumophila subsp. pneumophila]HAT9105257.1 conjugal transfer protein TrbH [Legionella pneumophila subsp. pneumophila]HAT9673390.1 conjugal transfer protein TrbH [Legionella pneumophila subsp. pneumophila]
MRKLSVLLLVIVLSSCASIQYGNFTVPSQSKDIYLAKNAASQLTQVYPPAQNTFYISQKVSDGFGINLIHEMRNKGYGVIESVQPGQKANLFYVVDEDRKGSLYRVSLYVGSQTLSRVYVKTKEQIAPASPWSHKE